MSVTRPTLTAFSAGAAAVEVFARGRGAVVVVRAATGGDEKDAGGAEDGEGTAGGTCAHLRGTPSEIEQDY